MNYRLTAIFTGKTPKYDLNKVNEYDKECILHRLTHNIDKMLKDMGLNTIIIHVEEE